MPKQSMSTPSSFPLRRLYTFSEGFIWTSLLQNEAVRRLRVQFHCTWHAHLTSWQSTAWALYDIHRTGSFCHQTIPSKGSWLDFQSCWTSVVLADFSARCKSSARAQQLWMSDWLRDILKSSAVQGGPQWVWCWHETGCFTTQEEKSTHALWPNRQLMGEMQQWHKKCGASWGNHHSSKHNEHLLATYMATCVMH